MIMFSEKLFAMKRLCFFFLALYIMSFMRCASNHPQKESSLSVCDLDSIEFLDFALRDTLRNLKITLDKNFGEYYAITMEVERCSGNLEVLISQIVNQSELKQNPLLISEIEGKASINLCWDRENDKTT